MSLATEIALLISVDEKQLLQCVPVNATLDAGQWRVPLTLRLAAPVPPNPALCGIRTDAASGLDAWLRKRGLNASNVLACVDLGRQLSPPWHPKPQDLDVLEVKLNTRPQHLDDEIWQWASEREWLQAWKEQALLLNPFTQALLEARHAGQSFMWHDIAYEQALAGLHVIPVRSHTLPPASHTNAFLLGDGQADSPRLLVDPSPADDVAFNNLRACLQHERIDAIFLTHHHPDHHQQATRLARSWRCPVWCSADTRARIPERFGADYWAETEVITIRHEDILTQWKGTVVRAYAVPGHDAGQLALMPDGREWMIVGDLIQGIGTVVIAEPEGNMAAYFDTLAWVIDQDPDVIIPSHGQAMGSTFRIAETLHHRQRRENQVLALHREGHTPQGMVEIIYAEVDKRLWGLARQNIDCHLKKLSEEGRL